MRETERETERQSETDRVGQRGRGVNVCLSASALRDSGSRGRATVPGEDGWHFASETDTAHAPAECR